MQTQAQRGMGFNMQLANFDKVRIEEVFRLGVLRDGIQLTTTDLRFPIYGQVIPRIEIVITGPDFLKKVTVRINQSSGFMFDGETLQAWINSKQEQVPCIQFVDPERAPTGMYNFGTMRENGIRSFVFDYHTYCAFSCDYCFKENEWEVLSIQGGASTNYKANFEQCMSYIDDHAEDFRTKYDIVWLCTGSIVNEETELQRHTDISKKLRDVGYQEGIYVSQVVPASIKDDRARRIDYLSVLKEAGISRFNSGVEIVNTEARKRFIHGFKGSYTFDDFVNVFEDAVSVFGHQGVGSCLLAGIEPAKETLYGLDTIAALGVVPSPTVLTPFVVKQQAIPFVYDLDELIDVHLTFYKYIEKYKLPVFSGVFSLA
jgi:hypothetical protein